jgi:multiple sugar transport system permease protein
MSLREVPTTAPDAGVVRGQSQPTNNGKAGQQGSGKSRRRGLGVEAVFLSPAVIVVLLLSIFPLIFSLLVAFTGLNFQSLASGLTLPFNGLENWDRLVNDSGFLKALTNTILYVAIGIPVQFCIGLALAMALNQAYIKGQRFFRTIFLLPMMLTPAAVGFVIGRTIFAQGNGPLNAILGFIGLPEIAWEASGIAAFAKVIMIDAWQWIPFMTILLFAGLRSLPQEPYEAASVDGASPWTVFRTLTFPMLWPVAVTALLIRGIELFKLIDIVQIATGGGPGRSTTTVTLYAYETVFLQFNLGYGAAMAITLLIFMIVFTTAFLLMARRKLD